MKKIKRELRYLYQQRERGFKTIGVNFVNIEERITELLEVIAYKKLTRWAVKRLLFQSKLVPTVTKENRYNINEHWQVELYGNEKKINICKELI